MLWQGKHVNGRDNRPLQWRHADIAALPSGHFLIINNVIAGFPLNENKK
jgi:hypothetical protein